MKPIRFLFYVKDVNRPIVMTDVSNTKSREDLEKELSSCLAGTKILSFGTKDDLFISKPWEIRGILVQNVEKNDTNNFEDGRIEAVENIDIADGTYDDFLEDLDILETETPTSTEQPEKSIYSKFDVIGAGRRRDINISNILENK